MPHPALLTAAAALLPSRILLASCDGTLIDPAPAVTDREGRARATWRLGPTAGKERRRMAVEGLATWLESTTVPDVPEHLT